MNQLQVFNHELFGKLTVEVIETAEMFDLHNVAWSLGYTRQSKGTDYLRYDRVNAIIEKLDIATVDRGGQLYIDESGLYDFVFEAGTTRAREFRKWVTSEVLPSIRKHGAYMTPNKIEEALLNPDMIITLATKLKEELALKEEERNKRLAAEKVIELQRPKVVYAEAVTVSEDTVLVKDLATVLKQKGIDIGHVRLFEWLRENGYLCKQKGEMWNMPTQRSLDLGVIVVKHGLRTGTDGEMRKTRTPKITGKGQIYFINKFLSQQKVV